MVAIRRVAVNLLPRDGSLRYRTFDTLRRWRMSRRTGALVPTSIGADLPVAVPAEGAYELGAGPAREERDSAYRVYEARGHDCPRPGPDRGGDRQIIPCVARSETLYLHAIPPRIVKGVVRKS